MRLILRVPKGITLDIPDYRDRRDLEGKHPSLVSEAIWSLTWVVVTPETAVTTRFGDVSAVVALSDHPNPMWDSLARVSCQAADLGKVADYLRLHAHALVKPERCTLKPNDEMEKEIQQSILRRLS